MIPNKMKWLLNLVLVHLLVSSAGAVDVHKIRKIAIDSVVKVMAVDRDRFVSTGVVMDTQHVFTHSKILSHPYQELLVVTSRGVTYPARPRGMDPENSLTLLQVKGGKLKPLAMARRGQVGDEVILLGGFYQTFPAVFKGIISSLDHRTLIVDSSIVPGSIGGAVLNTDGELLGIIRGKMGFTTPFIVQEKMHVYRINKEATLDLCLAAPVNRLRYSLASILEFGEVRKPWLGVSIASDTDPGIKILAVQGHSPAEEAGIQAGDRILEFNRTAVSTPSALSQLVSGSLPGSIVKLKIQRDEQLQNLRVTVGNFRKPDSIRYSFSQGVSVPSALPDFFSLLPEPLDTENSLVFSFGPFSGWLRITGKIHAMELTLRKLRNTLDTTTSSAEIQEIRREIQLIRESRKLLFEQLFRMIREVDDKIQISIEELEARLRNRGQSRHTADHKEGTD